MLYSGAPILRQLSLLSAEVGRLVRLRPALTVDLAAAVANVAGLVEVAAKQAATATSVAAEAGAARYVRVRAWVGGGCKHQC